MSDTKDNAKSEGILIPPSHANMIETLLSTLPKDEIELMRRIHRLNQPPETHDSPLSDASALVYHAVTVGLTQLMKAINSSGIYHQSAELEISSILHSCIMGKEPFRLIETEFILSKLEPSTEDEPDLEELLASLVVSESDEPKQ